MKTFQNITIVRNPISYIHEAAFYGLINLNELKISSVFLNTAPSLQYVGRTLEILMLPRCHVQPDISYFLPCRTLRRVEIDRNEMETLEWGLHNIAHIIKIIDASRNKIRSLTPMEGILFTELSTLDLSTNRITFLRGSLLLFPKLKHLMLINNLLVDFKDRSVLNWGKALPYFHYLSVKIKGNPWHCNGSMAWLTENLYDVGGTGNLVFVVRRYRSPVVICHVDQYYCHSPETILGKRVIPAEVKAIRIPENAFLNVTCTFPDAPYSSFC